MRKFAITAVVTTLDDMTEEEVVAKLYGVGLFDVLTRELPQHCEEIDDFMHKVNSETKKLWS